ncbi:hypothetical protein EON65_34325 [archaeon]|nr:MAG: hypothetical protein EON65_34325 [archaeon]
MYTRSYVQIHEQAHLLNIFLHFVGSVFLSWLITQQWTYRALWPLVVCTNLPSALYEIIVLFGINIFRIIY